MTLCGFRKIKALKAWKAIKDYYVPFVRYEIHYNESLMTSISSALVVNTYIGC